MYKIYLFVSDAVSNLFRENVHENDMTFEENEMPENDVHPNPSHGVIANDPVAMNVEAFAESFYIEEEVEIPSGSEQFDREQNEYRRWKRLAKEV